MSTLGLKTSEKIDDAIDWCITKNYIPISTEYTIATYISDNLELCELTLDNDKILVITIPEKDDFNINNTLDEKYRISFILKYLIDKSPEKCDLYYSQQGLDAFGITFTTENYNIGKCYDFTMIITQQLGIPTIVHYTGFVIIKDDFYITVF